MSSVLADLPAVAGPLAAAAALDLISIEQLHAERCPNTFLQCGFRGISAVIISRNCAQWECPVCGPRKAQRYAGIARGGCELATERVRLLTITSPRESPAESWAQLGRRWHRLSESLARRLGRRLSYFGTVELQRRGNPHLHLLLRDSGYVPKAVIHGECFGAGFGLSDIRGIEPGAGVQYVTKYLHKSAGQEFPDGARRIRRSRDWFGSSASIKCEWGPGWSWRSGEGLDREYLGRQLRGAGYTVVELEQRPERDGD